MSSLAGDAGAGGLLQVRLGAAAVHAVLAGAARGVRPGSRRPAGSPPTSAGPPSDPPLAVAGDASRAAQAARRLPLPPRHLLRGPHAPLRRQAGATSPDLRPISARAPPRRQAVAISHGLSRSPSISASSPRQARSRPISPARRPVRRSPLSSPAAAAQRTRQKCAFHAHGCEFISEDRQLGWTRRPPCVCDDAVPSSLAAPPGAPAAPPRPRGRRAPLGRSPRPPALGAR